MCNFTDLPILSLLSFYSVQELIMVLSDKVIAIKIMSGIISMASLEIGLKKPMVIIWVDLFILQPKLGFEAPAMVPCLYWAIISCFCLTKLSKKYYLYYAMLLLQSTLDEPEAVQSSFGLTGNKYICFILTMSTQTCQYLVCAHSPVSTL